MDAHHNDGYALVASFVIPMDQDGSTTATGKINATTPVAIVGFIAMAFAAGIVCTALLTLDRWDPHRSRRAPGAGDGDGERPEV